MRKNILTFSLIIATVAITLSSCKKDDTNQLLNNPTNGKTTAEFNSSVTYGTMTDQDGNMYKTVTIGNQTWMAENLRTTKYNDGTLIPFATDKESWSNLDIPAYCNYRNTKNIDTIATFGRLYNWYAVNTNKLAPTGWHVATDADWTILTTYLGGENTAGGKLKETGTTHWKSYNTIATNSTGFTALPAGYRGPEGDFYGIREFGFWWSATIYHDNISWGRRVDFFSAYLSHIADYMTAGLSVRCVKN